METALERVSKKEENTSIHCTGATDTPGAAHTFLGEFVEVVRELF